MKRRSKTSIPLKIFVVITAMFIIGPIAFPGSDRSIEETDFGLTYSVTYAESLGLDPVGAFESIVGELQPDHVRIPVYWNRIEMERGVYEWAELDSLMELAAANDTDVILAIGRKVPRWPECHLPVWAPGYDKPILDAAQLSMMKSVVERYKEHDALLRWQVENEPYFFLFGECPRPDVGLIEQEYNMVKSLDPNRDIQATASGEQSLWIAAARNSDVVGVSMYRTTYTPGVGHITYPIPPWTYRAKAALFAQNRVVVSELQAEPWFARDISTYTIDEQLDLFGPAKFHRHIDYAVRAGFPEVSLWGAEWWYYLKEQGHSEIWDTAMELF